MLKVALLLKSSSLTFFFATSNFSFFESFFTRRWIFCISLMILDRLNRALKMLKQTKRKSKRLILLLEWFFCSHLLSGIELKVEHWQVSSQANQGQHGVYTAGIDFSRYDPIVKGFSDSLSKTSRQ